MVRVATLNNESTCWAIRIHQCDGVNDDTITDFCNNLDGACVMAKETEASRIHYQGWIISGLKEITLRVRIKKAFPTTVGNRGYSLKEVRELEKYLPYVCKGTREIPPVIVFRRGIQYTDDWISAQYDSFWKDDRSTSYEMKKSKMSAHDMIWEKVDKLDKVTPRNVCMVIIDTYTSVSKSYDVYGVRRLMNTIMSKYSPQFRKAIANAVLSDPLYDAFEDTNNTISDNIRSVLEFDFI